jgi:hypothetical protein
MPRRYKQQSKEAKVIDEYFSNGLVSAAFAG